MMNKEQLRRVLAYIDAEYVGISKRMTTDEKLARENHWASELGDLDFDSVMNAVRKLSRGEYVPRTAEIIAEVENSRSVKHDKTKCLILIDSNGDEILDYRSSDGFEMSGYLKMYPEWMQKKFRWMANPTPENTLAWDEYILEHEKCNSTVTSQN